MVSGKKAKNLKCAMKRGWSLTCSREGNARGREVREVLLHEK